MNIAYIAFSKIPSREANSVHVMKICSALATARPAAERREHNVTLIVPGNVETQQGVDDIYEYYGVPQSFEVEKVYLKYPFIKYYKNTRLSHAAARFAAAGGDNYDLIYSRDPLACLYVTRFCNIPVYLEYHSVFTPGSKADKRFRALIKSGNFKRLIVITDALKKRFMEQYKLPESMIYVAPDCADMPSEDIVPAKLIFQSAGKYQVGYTGHLYQGKGMEHLGDIAKLCPFAFFHIAGGTEKDIAFWREKYKDITNIHFYGFLPPAQTAAFAKAMDVLIAPYQTRVLAANSHIIPEDIAAWMSPLKLFEYMALCKPIICSDLPVIREVLRDGENALLCPPDDAAVWVRAIERLNKDSETAKKIAARAFAEFKEKYTWSSRAEKLLRDVMTERITYFGFPGKHVFSGYYDISSISNDGSKMLVHVVDKNADPRKHPAKLGYFDLPGGEYHEITSTRAWCLQQGARLRWHPQEGNKVLCNDTDGSGYVTKEIDITTGQSRVVAPALYDISYDFKYGVSVNFVRLQRLRPGYGYDVLPDITAGDNAPDNDGVFLIDLKSGCEKLIVSLSELASRELAGREDNKSDNNKSGDNKPEGEHYINHISFSPDGRRFIFFHVTGNDARTGTVRRLQLFMLKVLRNIARLLRADSSRFNPRKIPRKVKLYLYDIETQCLELIEGERSASHYCWSGSGELLYTSTKDGSLNYILYNLQDKTKTVLEHPMLSQDGHPTFVSAEPVADTVSADKFITDTYPDEKSMQKLFIYDMKHDKVNILSEFYHKKVKHNDMRCDLHPRLWQRDNNTGISACRGIITVDTTCRGGVRQVALLRMPDDCENDCGINCK